MTHLSIEPRVAIHQPAPFTLSIEPCRGPVYTHGFHLGTDEVVARAFAREIFEHVRVHEGGCYTVALMRDHKIFDVWDGLDWFNDLTDRMSRSRAVDSVAVRMWDEVRTAARATHEAAPTASE